MPDSTELAEHFPVGTPVLAWTGTRDDAPRWTKTRSEPWQLGHGAWVVAVEGVAGGIAMSHIERIPDGWVNAAEQPNVASIREEAARLGRRATLDPGAFVKRGREDGDYEPMSLWQERAMQVALAEFAVEAGA